MPKTFNISAIAAYVILLTSVGLAQQSTSPSSPNNLKPTNCEMNAAMLDRVPQNRFQGEAENDLVIAIAHLGEREYSSELNRRRLFNVRYRLENYRGLNPKRIVVAQGEGVKGYGRVELYVDGVLFEVLVAERGKDLCVSCCGINEDFYPERTKRKRNR